jgi:hypothetical protein
MGSYSPSDAPAASAAGAGAPGTDVEIEVTPEMIAAGESVFRFEAPLVLFVEAWESTEPARMAHFVAAIEMAMAKARPEPLEP